MNAGMPMEYPPAASSRGAAAPPQLEAGAAPLFPENETDSFRSRWQEIQVAFVDDPRRAVVDAEKLVSAVIGRLSEVFSGEQDKAEHGWPQEGEGSTEELRQALRRYHSFFDRLLSV